MLYSSVHNRISEKRPSTLPYIGMDRFKKQNTSSPRCGQVYFCRLPPDETEDPEGYKVVLDMMVHGPCGAANTKATCMQGDKCTKKFPKKYNEKTFLTKKWSCTLP